MQTQLQFNVYRQHDGSLHYIGKLQMPPGGFPRRFDIARKVFGTHLFNRAPVLEPLGDLKERMGRQASRMDS